MTETETKCMKVEGVLDVKSGFLLNLKEDGRIIASIWKHGEDTVIRCCRDDSKEMHRFDTADQAIAWAVSEFGT